MCTDKQKQRLKLDALILDQVAETIDQVPYMTSSPFLVDSRVMAQCTQEMEDWDDACWDLVTRSVSSPSSEIDTGRGTRTGTGTYVPTGEHLYEAYWRALIFDTDPEQRGQRASPGLKDAYEAWVSSFATSNEITRLKLSQPNPPTPEYQQQLIGVSLRLAIQSQAGYPFETAFQQYTAGRKFFATKRGYIGWVSVATRPGDFVCYLEGNPLPFVIRRWEMQGYKLVGDCYLHGLMRGPGREGEGIGVKKIVLF